MLSTYISPDYRNWNVILPFLTFAYNSAKQKTTGYSPFFLVFGRSPSITFESSFFYAPVASDAPSHEQYVSRLAHSRDLARRRTEIRQHERKTRYDVRHRFMRFRPGDEVLLWTPVRVPGLCEKFLHRFRGPYQILEETSPVNYRITPVTPTTDHRRRGTEIVHVSRLKPFNRRTTD